MILISEAVNVALCVQLLLNRIFIFFFFHFHITLREATDKLYGNRINHHDMLFLYVLLVVIRLIRNEQQRNVCVVDRAEDHDLCLSIKLALCVGVPLHYLPASSRWT